jgi:hypothetical protein
MCQSSSSFTKCPRTLLRSSSSSLVPPRHPRLPSYSLSLQRYLHSQNCQTLLFILGNPLPPPPTCCFLPFACAYPQHPQQASSLSSSTVFFSSTPNASRLLQPRSFDAGWRRRDARGRGWCFGFCNRRARLQLTLHQALAVAARRVGETGWLTAAAAAAAAAAASAVSGSAADHVTSSMSSTSQSHLLLLALLDATSSARRLLSFPSIADVQRCICDALFIAASSADGCDDRESKLWGVNSVLADLFTGDCFGSTGDLRASWAIAHVDSHVLLDVRCVSFKF